MARPLARIYGRLPGRILTQKSFLAQPIVTGAQRNKLRSLGHLCGLSTYSWSPKIVVNARHKNWNILHNKSCCTNTSHSLSSHHNTIQQSRKFSSSNVLVSSCMEKRAVTVQWKLTHKQKECSQDFPFVWLRDVCRCPLCFNSTVQSRVFDFTQIDPDVYPLHIKINEQSDDHVLKIDWSDGHTSEFSVEWLQQFKFQATEKDLTFDPNVRYWGADVGETQLKFFEFADLLESDVALHNWLIEIQELGLTVIRNAPQELGQLYKIGERVAFLRSCNYGPTFQVKSKKDASNAGYISTRLSLHTDLTYYIWAPGVQLLHCITQTGCPGGENFLSDGFKAAEELKQEDPASFKILTSTLLEYFDVGTDHVGKFHQHARHPVIQLGDKSEINCVYWSDTARYPMLRIPTDDVQPLYRAMKAWHSKLYLPENLFTYKMESGDILCLNNKRTLHGRAAYTATTSANRHLEGSYLEWDEINSKLRVLKAALGGKA